MSNETRDEMTDKTHKTLSAPEQAQLQDRVEELTALLRVRDGEIAGLKSRTNMLCRVLSKHDDDPHIMSILNDIPTQSLHDHDKALAEMVREACAHALSDADSMLRIFNLDLTAIVRGEGEETQ